MMEKKQDIRITKTQRALAHALLALLENQSFSKITVNDICNEALVSRSTFYTHFEDKYRLLHFSIKEVERSVFADANKKEMRDLLLHILKNMQENAKTLRNLMVAELDMELIEMFRQHFIEIFRRRMTELGIGNEVPAWKAEVVASFYAAGISQTTALWIAQKLPIGIEDMADTLYELLQALVHGAAAELEER